MNECLNYHILILLYVRTQFSMSDTLYQTAPQMVAFDNKAPEIRVTKFESTTIQ